MDHVISFFKNKWTKIGFSAISLGYGFFMVWLAFISFTYHLVPTNPVSLFSLFLLVNVLFGVVMVYTRKEIATQITACLLHPCILVMLVFAFGNWFLLIPVFAVSTVVFFAAGSAESLKTILGTIYLILFVLTTLAYLTLQIFSINLFDVNIDLRSDAEDYLYSKNGTYRLVMYMDRENKENRTVDCRVEFTPDDLKLPFLDCERYANSKGIIRQRFTDVKVETLASSGKAQKIIITNSSGYTEIKWETDTKLSIIDFDREGEIKNSLVRDVSLDEIIPDEDDEFDYSGETGLFHQTQSQTMTTAATSAPQAP